jgi:hypothetical protein
MNSAMRKTPPTAKKPMLDSGASVIAIAILPSKANITTHCSPSIYAGRCEPTVIHSSPSPDHGAASRREPVMNW